MSRSRQTGFALIAVLGIVLIVTGVALALAANMRTQVLQAMNDRSGLEAEQLCAAGQQMADYLRSRGLGTPAEKLADLPVDVLQPAFHYRLRFPAGNVDLYLDAEDGKINLSSVRPEVLSNFLTLWAQDRTRAEILTAMVLDWRDIDDVALPNGAESTAYAPFGFKPRNQVFGVGDVSLLLGLDALDFRDRLVRSVSGTGSWERRHALGEFLTNAPLGSTINPNFAPELILRALPGMNDAVAVRAVEERRRQMFSNWSDFATRAGLPLESPTQGFVHFGRTVPAVLTIVRSDNGRLTRSERRVADPFWVEYNRIPAYVNGG